jgi:membrane protease YdiL (CAAX protease family)
MLAVQPWLGRRRYRGLQQQLHDGSLTARERFYKNGIVRQGLLVVLVWLIAKWNQIPLVDLGLNPPNSWTDTGTTLGILLVAIAISIVIFRRRGDRQFGWLIKMAGAILPISRVERWWFAGVGVGAGISEELVFRGFLFYYVWFYLPGLGPWARLMVVSAAFGFAHLYQGWRGVLATTVAGLTFGLLYYGSGSLLVPAIVHAAVDLRILAILTPKRLELLKKANGAAVAAPLANESA